jgi:lipid-binding SYLF domain-containing protein
MERCAVSRFWFALVLTVVACVACSPSEPPQSPASAVLPQQSIIDRSAAALASMRSSGKFRMLDDYLKSAAGVMIFPRLVKAGLLLGGEGGNGVLVARGPDGSFSAPAFYSIGGGSVGLQIGYQETSLVLIFMSRAALLSAIERGVTLGSDVTVAAGTVGDASDAHRESTAKDIYYFADARGIFAGLSLDGAVISSRARHNGEYYGPGATAAAIVLERSFDRPGTASLKSALAP